MVSIDEIKDPESLTAWLKTRSQADSIAIKQRTGLRFLPLWGRAMARDWSRKAELTALPVMRSLLTSGIARRYPTSDVERASASASAFVDHGNSIAASAITDATPTPMSAAPLFHQIRNDALILFRDDDPFVQPLWQDTPPFWFTEADAQMRAIWAKDPPAHWAFWTRWWDGVLEGKPLNWDLQHDIALIPDEVWQAGPGPVAEAIAKIVLDHTITANPNSEDVKQDNQGLFYAVPVTTIRPDLFRDAKEKVADTIAKIRVKATSNAYYALTDDLASLDDVLTRYPDRPQRIHDEFESSLASVTRKLATNEVAASDIVDRLCRELDDGAIDIRRSDTEVAKTVKARFSSKLTRLNRAQKAELDKGMTAVAEVSREDFKAEILEDIAATNDPNLPIEQKDEPAYRLASRGAKVTKIARETKDTVVKTADDVGKIAKAGEAIGKVAEQAPTWWETLTAFFTNIL